MRGASAARSACTAATLCVIASSRSPPHLSRAYSTSWAGVRRSTGSPDWRSASAANGAKSAALCGASEHGGGAPLVPSSPARPQSAAASACGGSPPPPAAAGRRRCLRWPPVETREPSGTTSAKCSRTSAAKIHMKSWPTIACGGAARRRCGRGSEGWRGSSSSSLAPSSCTRCASSRSFSRASSSHEGGSDAASRWTASIRAFRSRTTPVERTCAESGKVANGAAAFATSGTRALDAFPPPARALPGESAGSKAASGGSGSHGAHLIGWWAAPHGSAATESRL